MYRSVNNKKKASEMSLNDLFFNLLNLVKRYYYLFLIGIVLSLTLAYVYLKSRGEIYNVYTSLIIEEDGGDSYSNGNFNDDMMYSGVARLMPGSNNVDNQIYILRSHDNIFKTVKKLNIDVNYYKEKYFVCEQIFNDYPFQIIINKSKPQLVETKFNVEFIDEAKFKISVKTKGGDMYDYTYDKIYKRITDYEYEGIHQFGELINTNCFSFYFKGIENDFSDYNFSFVINNPQIVTKKIRDNLSIKRVMESGGVVEIALKARTPELGKKILNTFTEVYLEYNLNKKNAVVDKMIEFIESQFDNISTTLKASDDKLQYFQSNKDVVDIAAQGQIVIEQVNSLENEKAVISSKLVYLENLKNKIINGDNHASMVAPTAMGIDDEVLNNLVNRINEISIQRSALVSGLNNAEVNPQVIAIDAQLNGLKKSLLDNVNNILSQINIFRKDINRRIAKNNRLLKELPSKQRGLVNIQRNNEINSELYSKLLERKLNYYIMKASNFHNKDVVQEARLAEKIPLIQRKEFIYVFALMWGLLVPACIIILIVMFDNKIKSKADVEEITNFPFLGVIPKVKDESEKKIMENPLSPFSESYRLIRYRLRCMKSVDKCMKILVTSTFPQEGKTLTSINIASTFAMLKKKSIVIGCDLRKPALGAELNMNEKVGVSSYLIGDSDVKDIIKKTDNEFLDVIVSGPKHPSPSELIESNNLEKLVYELEKIYEYVIIDTPPVGVVSDALLLSRIVDLKLLIVRSGKTNKKAFEEIINRLEENNSNNVGIIFNADENSHENYYGYKYSSYCRQV